MNARVITVCALATPLLAAQAQNTPAAPATTPAAPAAAPANTPASAATTPATPAPGGLEQSIQHIKNPVSWMTWGADFRVRDEYYESYVTLNPHNPFHLQNYLRFRGRIWMSLSPFEDLSLNARLSDEPREYFRPPAGTAMKGRTGLDLREGVIDNLNVQWRNILHQPMAATVGRQDITLGDGWLTGDGTPLDGSWTYYLDAARLTYEFKEQHTTVDAIGIIQDAKDDGWLPTINNQNLYVTEQNEKGAILWVANKSVAAANLDGYFIYKHDDKVNPFGPSNPAPAGGDNADIFTLGGRVSGLVAEHWKYSAEGAYQFGQKQDALVKYPTTSTAFRDLNAFGVNTRVSYLFKDSLNNQVGLAYEFLSGDNPDTQNDEAFDNLWGRYPRWSELGLYSYAAETRIGNEANLHRFGPTWSITPAKNLDFSAAYFALFAPEEVATRGTAGLFSNSGNFRGHFVQTVLRYKFSKHVSAHLWAEFEFPGDYYVYHNTRYFLRPEVLFTF